MATYADIYRRVKLHAPDAPIGLVKDWTQAAYNQLAERRPWNWLRTEYQIQTLAARNLAVVVTAGSTTVTSAGLFVSTDAGRQFRIGTYPLYTINTFTDINTVVLDQAYTGTGGAQTGQILDAYVTMPVDFGAFLLVTDPTNQRLISWWHTQEELGRLDPTRTSSDANPRALIARKLSSRPATLGQMQYEWWPYPTAAKAFPSYYRARPAALADDYTFAGVLATRAEILETGALARCARWPGTADRPNPYFNNVTARELRDEFDRACAALELRDDDQAQESWASLPAHRWGTWDLWADTEYLRQTDATVIDYI